MTLFVASKIFLTSLSDNISFKEIKFLEEIASSPPTDISRDEKLKSVVSALLKSSSSSPIFFEIFSFLTNEKLSSCLIRALVLSMFLTIISSSSAVLCNRSLALSESCIPASSTITRLFPCF